MDCRKEIASDMFRAKYGGYWILGIIAFLGLFAGTLAWYVHYIANLANTPNQVQVISPIDLAGVTATLGGLVLVGAFYKGKDASNDEEKQITDGLKLVGKIMLLSSVCFIITYFSLEYVRTITSKILTDWDWFYVIITDFAAIFAIISLSVALSFLVVITRFI
jgi:hypothetical protein